jgi:hypothetical protein
MSLRTLALIYIATASLRGEEEMCGGGSGARGGTVMQPVHNRRKATENIFDGMNRGTLI